MAAATGTQWGQSMTAGDIYTVAGGSSGTSGDTGDGGAATSAKFNSPAGGLRLGRRALHEREREQHAADGGRPSGTRGHRGARGHLRRGRGPVGERGVARATGAPPRPTPCSSPPRVAVDSSGDLYIADPGNNRIQETAATTGTQWGQSMTAGDIYTVAGSSSGSSGHTGDGGAATSAKLRTRRQPSPSTRPATSTSPTPATTGSKRCRPPRAPSGASR